MESKENSNQKNHHLKDIQCMLEYFKMQHSSNSARFHRVLLHILGYQWNETLGALSLL